MFGSWPMTVGFLASLVLCGGFTIRFFRLGERDVDGTIGSIIAPVILSLYLVAAAVALVIGWENNDQARTIANEESTTATDLYWTAHELPGAHGAAIRADLRRYVRYVIADDWPRMRDGELSGHAGAALDRLRGAVAAIPASSYRGAGDRMIAIQQVNDLAKYREDRRAGLGRSVPLLLVGVTAVTGLAVVVLPIATHPPDPRVHVFWNAVATVFVGAAIAMVVLVNNAYTGPFAVSPGPLQSAAQGFTHIDRMTRQG